MFKIANRRDEGSIEEWANGVAAQKLNRVLDVGGAAKPLRSATHVMDVLPYSGRRVDEGRGSLPERFTQKTWFVRDACRTPWPGGGVPWPDNYFDYVWCSQLVEDVRDPIGVCREMLRVGIAGYISTVQRQYESSVLQEDGVVGYHHHRWLIEADTSERTLTFTFKTPLLQVSSALRPPFNRDNWLLHIMWGKDMSGENPFMPVENFLTEGWMQREELQVYLRERRWLK